MSAAPTADQIFGNNPLASVRPTSRMPLNVLLEQAGVHHLTSASPAEDLRDALEQLKAGVVSAHLDDTDRATLNKLVLDTLAEQKIKNVRPLVRAALGELVPSSSTKPTAAPSITLIDDEPATEPVDGAALLDETVLVIRRHVILTPAQSDAVALWIAAAFLIDALALMPILLITAPTMRSGKTTLLTLLSALVRRALTVSNLTGAVLARAIAAFHPTLLADEADTWLTDEASELRGIMNAGHTRPTAYILRCAPDTHDPMLIPCFCARVISMIRRPPSTIVDRAIVIDLRRKRADESVTRLRVDRLHDHHQQLRRQWRRWADDHLEPLREADPELPAGLHDRAADNWRPLIGIADIIGEDWPARARAAAEKLSKNDDAEDSASLTLLQDVRAVFESRAVSLLASAELTAALVALPDRPWAEWSGGRPMTSVKLAARLKPFGLRSHKVRVGRTTINGYDLSDFLDIWSRYLPNDPTPKQVFNSEQSEQPNVFGLCSEFCDSEQNTDVPTPKTRNNPTLTESVPTVPSPNADPREETKKGEDGWLDL